MPNADQLHHGPHFLDSKLEWWRERESNPRGLAYEARLRTNAHPALINHFDKSVFSHVNQNCSILIVVLT